MLNVTVHREQWQRPRLKLGNEANRELLVGACAGQASKTVAQFINIFCISNNGGDVCSEVALCVFATFFASRRENCFVIHRAINNLRVVTLSLLWTNMFVHYESFLGVAVQASVYKSVSTRLSACPC